MVGVYVADMETINNLAFHAWSLRCRYGDNQKFGLACLEFTLPIRRQLKIWPCMPGVYVADRETIKNLALHVSMHVTLSY